MPENPNEITPVKEIRVVKKIDDYKVVLNVGERDHIREGMRFLLFELTHKKIIDPDTKEDLGVLELVKGTGRVIHVQPRISTIESDKKQWVETRPAHALPAGLSFPFGGFVYSRTEKEPFDDVREGDLAKRI